MWPFKNKWKQHAEYMEFNFNLQQDRGIKLNEEISGLENKILALQIRNQKLVEKNETLYAKLTDCRKRNKNLVAAVNRRGKKNGQ